MVDGYGGNGGHPATPADQLHQPLHLQRGRVDAQGDVPGNVRQAAEARLEVGRLPAAQGEVVGVAEEAPAGEGRPPEEVQEEEEK